MMYDRSLHLNAICQQMQVFFHHSDKLRESKRKISRNKNLPVCDRQIGRRQDD